MRFFCIESGFQDGVYNMALDEALLETVRAQTEPVLIVRTYLWDAPTLSLGANQAVRDIDFLLDYYGKRVAEGQSIAQVVRRPTGGRAILHGEDISYSFITNQSSVLKQSLSDSYAKFAGLVQETLRQLGISGEFCRQACNKDYVRSPICFETQTPSDLRTDDGSKLTGSAQLRRTGGQLQPSLLQHGAAFLKPYGIQSDVFSQKLFEVTAVAYGLQPESFPVESIASLLKTLEAVYLKTSGEMRDSASTTSGSHLLPASC